MNQSDDIPALITDLIVPERDGGYSKGRETREMILRAALSILIDEGYRAMSMRRVAAACGMKFGNLTYHYRTREDLVRELLDAVIRSYEQEFDAIVHGAGLSPEQRLERYCLLVLNDITTRKTTRLFPNFGLCRTTTPSCTTGCTSYTPAPGGRCWKWWPRCAPISPRPNRRC